MSAWLRLQFRTLRATLLRVVRSPLATAFNVVVLAIALALPTALYVALSNVQSAARAAAPEPQLTVFMRLEASRAEARALETRLKGHGDAAGVRYVPKDQALEDLKRASGLRDVIEGLGRNPLPDAFVVTARDASAVELARIQKEFARLEGVESVQVDTEWARRLDAILELGRVTLGVLAVALALALVAVTFNTIRLQILTQREEIEVASLIGATASFIRRPFLYYGAVLGLLGGAAACGLVALALHVMNEALGELTQLYGTSWQLQFLGTGDLVSLLLFAAVLGWLGAWLSVARHLATYEPR